MSKTSRVERHRVEARHWSVLSDASFVALLTSTGLLERGGGPVEGAAESAHVKLVPLSARELAAPGSTANLFELPALYHHRFGSLGFGAWRELALHRRANRWVLDGSCERFVLLRHARVLPVIVEPTPPEPAPWRGDAAIEAREAAARDATHALALVFESFPETLRETVSRSDTALPQVQRFERQLWTALDHCHSQGMLHLDPHLGNVLSDGSDAYLADFGLGTAFEFERTQAERDFADTHAALDTSIAVTGLVHAVVRSEAPDGPWREALDRQLSAESTSAELREFLRAREPVVARLGAFYADLRQDLSTPFPAAELEAALLTLRTT